MRDCQLLQVSGRVLHGIRCLPAAAHLAISISKRVTIERAWGGNPVVLTAIPEPMLAREAEICCTLLTSPIGYD